MKLLKSKSFRTYSSLLPNVKVNLIVYYKRAGTKNLKFSKMNTKITILSLLLLFTLGSCNTDNTPAKVEGWSPIYQSSGQTMDIKSIDPQPVATAGKIYVRGNILFQVEPQVGIHLFDITDPEHPFNYSFIRIPGAQEISIKQNLLYSNNYNDLVIIDITELQNVKLLKRLEKAFNLENLDLPPMSGYFECVDPSKGKVIGWEKKTLISPKCKF